MNTVTIGKILTDSEIRRARQLHKRLKNTGTFARVLCDELILPNMERINKAVGQPNSAMYLAYVIEHVLNEAERRQTPAN